MAASTIVKSIDYLIDRALGIRTGGILSTSFPDAHSCSTVPHLAVSAILGRLALQAEDVFVDIGAGKGRVACCAARRALKEIIGIEVVPDLCELAEQNAGCLRGRKCPVTIENIYAQEFDYRRGTVFYLFNPFGRDTLLDVIKRMEASWYEVPRSVRIAYVNPVFQTEFEELGSLECYERWEAGARMFLQHPVSFWRFRTCS